MTIIDGTNKKAMNKKNYIKNRRLFFLLSFFIILPILMVTVFYVNTYYQNNGVIFEESGTKITNFTKLNLTTDEDDYQVLEAETNELVIHIRLDDITTESNENEDFLRYGFRLRYTAKDSGVVQTPVTSTLRLKANWSNKMSEVRTNNLTTGYSIVRNVDFKDVSFPFSPVPFVNINGPMLYLKVVYNYKTDNNLGDIQRVSHFSFYLNDLQTIAEQNALRDNDA